MPAYGLSELHAWFVNLVVAVTLQASSIGGGFSPQGDLSMNVSELKHELKSDYQPEQVVAFLKQLGHLLMQPQ